MKYDLILKDITHAQAQRVLDIIKDEDNYQADGKSDPVLDKSMEVVGSQLPNILPTFPPQPVVNVINPPAEKIEEARQTFRAGDFTPPAPAASTVPSEVDSEGFPWDARIHASTKTKTQKGVWKSRKGVSDELVAQVEAELKGGVNPTTQPPAGMQFTTSAPVNPQPIVPPAPTFVPPAPTFVPPVAHQAPNVFYAGDGTNPPAPTITLNQPAFVPPAAQPTITDFNGLMGQIARLFQQSLITPDYLNQLATKIGQAFNVQISSMTDIAANPQMIAYAVELLKQDGKLV